MTKINNILDEIRKLKEERITNVPSEIIGKNKISQYHIKQATPNDYTKKPVGTHYKIDTVKKDPILHLHMDKLPKHSSVVREQVNYMNNFFGIPAKLRNSETDNLVYYEYGLKRIDTQKFSDKIWEKEVEESNASTAKAEADAAKELEKENEVADDDYTQSLNDLFDQIHQRQQDQL